MQSGSSQQPFKAYYKTTLAVFFWLSGIVGCLLSFWFGIWAAFLLVATSILLFLWGFYCLRRPYFLLEPRQLTVYTLFGLVTRRYTFVSWEVVKADSRHIYLDDGGITKKVPVTPWLVKSADWAAMRKLL